MGIRIRRESRSSGVKKLEDVFFFDRLGRWRLAKRNVVQIPFALHRVALFEQVNLCAQRDGFNALFVLIFRPFREIAQHANGERAGLVDRFCELHPGNHPGRSLRKGRLQAFQSFNVAG